MAIKYVENFNYDKLIAELSKRGVTLSEASTALGHTASYISGNKNRSVPFKKAYMDIFETLYGVKEEDVVDHIATIKIEPIATVAKVVQADVNLVGLSHEVGNALYKIIYSAVYDAVKQVWSE